MKNEKRHKTVCLNVKRKRKRRYVHGPVLILYINIPFELNRCSLSKVIERTPHFDNGRTDPIGVTLNAPPPFFEWRGHNNEHMKYIELASITLRTDNVMLY